MKRSADHTKSEKPPKVREAAAQAIRLNTGAAEVLAPCGSLEAFFAAMESGADAVYAGLREFSARARAKNFTLGQMTRMLAYAHQRGRKIYITLNTLVKEQELPQLVETLAELARLRVDGVIVQDMAVARLVRNHFPSIPLHASTQMTIHNLPGVKLLEEYGFERVVLARELQLADIAAIASRTSAELEIFVHGALCFCVSGQCHFSSLLGGHSGNRGRCAQPCRRLYSHRGKEGYFFSPNDLSALELIPDLIAAGVTSLKIEGRMKSADYVAKVVKAYRLMVDGDSAKQKETLKVAKGLLKDSFGRTPTKGFLASSNPVDIANPWLRGGTGRFSGEVKQARQGQISFETRDGLQVGDRLRLQPKSDQAGTAWTLRELYVNRKKVHECKPGTLVEVVCPFEARPGDALFKVGAADAFGMSDEAANRKLQTAGLDRMAVRLELACRQEENGWSLSVSARIGAACFSYAFPLGTLEPARSSDMAGVLQARFSETGETPFRLENLQAPGFPSLFIPPARLKEIRRELYQRLEQEGAGEERKRITTAKAKALLELQGQGSRVKGQAGKEELILQVDSPADVRWALSQGASQVVVPLHRAAIHELPRYVSRLRGDAGQIVWQLPFMLFDQELPFMAEAVDALYQAGFRCFEITNPGQFKLLQQYAGLQLSSGYRLFTLNSQALAFWQEQGIQRATLYIEDDRENMANLLQLPQQLTVLVYSPVEVMATRVKIKEISSGAPLQSDRGEGYRIHGRDGFTHISATTPFSLLGRLAELRRMGCQSFQLDLSETPPERRSELLEAFRSDRLLQATTLFNYERGLI
ncbi:MAG: U32 family peptidase [Trichlorobacter sp.]|uniref:U32 family peptidase n=1 Tax=Trichlorobacter sp. TaxID=2911007 RepID=UPI002563AA2F|nr:U32 family peptidase [Trichlorobacter sp.]MDK9716524.1 U32 family peptidase [Trichlorobacter sp.]